MRSSRSRRLRRNTRDSRVKNAGRFAVARFGAAPWFPANPELDGALAQRGDIERELNGVKERKETLAEDKYYDELEACWSSSHGCSGRSMRSRRRTEVGAMSRTASAAGRQRLHSRRRARCCATLAAAACAAQPIDYDPRRASGAAGVRRASVSRSHRPGRSLLHGAARELSNAIIAGGSGLGAWRAAARERAVQEHRAGQRAGRRSRACAGAGCFCRRISTAMRPRCFSEALEDRSQRRAGEARARARARRTFRRPGAAVARGSAQGRTTTWSKRTCSPPACRSKKARSRRREKALDRAARAREQAEAAAARGLRAARGAGMSRASDNPDPWIKRALDYNPRYGGVYRAARAL